MSSNHSRETIMRRVDKELKEFQQSTDLNENVTAGPIDNDLFHWYAIIMGPSDSPYAGGIFRLDVRLPQKYPYEAPRISFTTKIYHPNISPSGQICLDILKNKWSPTLTIKKVLLSISSLLTDPNPDDPLDGGAARLYRESILNYNKKVKEYVKDYASE
jgi:ubiquitin-conjugating enzyme E2 D